MGGSCGLSYPRLCPEMPRPLWSVLASPSLPSVPTCMETSQEESTCSCPHAQAAGSCSRLLPPALRNGTRPQKRRETQPSLPGGQRGGPPFPLGPSLRGLAGRDFWPFGPLPQFRKNSTHRAKTILSIKFWALLLSWVRVGKKSSVPAMLPPVPSVSPGQHLHKYHFRVSPRTRRAPQR